MSLLSPWKGVSFFKWVLALFFGASADVAIVGSVVQSSAWKSSLKTGKRLRLNWTKTRKDWKKQDWTRLKTGKDHTKTGLYGPVFAVKTGLNW